MPTAVPLGDKLRVEVLPQGERSKILHTQSRETPLRKCKITAVGPDAKSEVGQIVLANLLSGQLFGEEVIIPQQAIVATLKE